MEKIKILFLGSNWEALHTLKVLYSDNRFTVIGVITQPDKPVGRKQEILPTEIKLFCNDNNIPVYHTLGDIERYKEAMSLFNPDVILCKSFGEIIPDFFLKYPKYGAINVHYSLLPLYRGAVPIQKAILDGAEITGISIVKMVEKFDAGPILSQHTEKILPNDTNLSLRERLVKLTGEILPDILYKWCNNEIDAIEQNHQKATFCWQKDIAKEVAEIDFIKDESVKIDRMCRALIPWPVAWFMFGEIRIKLFAISFIDTSEKDLLSNLSNQSEIGQLFTYRNRLFVKCQDKEIIEISDLQEEGKNRTKPIDFINGHKKSLLSI